VSKPFESLLGFLQVFHAYIKCLRDALLQLYTKKKPFLFLYTLDPCRKNHNSILHSLRQPPTPPFLPNTGCYSSSNSPLIPPSTTVDFTLPYATFGTNSSVIDLTKLHPFSSQNSTPPPSQLPEMVDRLLDYDDAAWLFPEISLANRPGKSVRSPIKTTDACQNRSKHVSISWTNGPFSSHYHCGP